MADGQSAPARLPARGTAVDGGDQAPYALVRAGGWGALELELPPGEWRDELADRRPFSSPVKVGELLADLPVALLTTDR
ncbi:hypothetical protein ACFQZC_29710 [Streptacidiphilus monticola]